MFLISGPQADQGLANEQKILYGRRTLELWDGETMRRRLSATIAAVLVVAAILVGCGGSSGGSASSSAPTEEASKQFFDPEALKGGKEAVATFGKEASGSERAEASAVLEENLTARQAGDIAGQCATLGKRGMESVSQESAKSPSKCVAELKKIAEPLSSTETARKDTLDGEIDAFRVGGNKAYALYHGNDGKDYAMPMEREDGSWKVGGILTIELPTEEAEPKPPKKKGA
jgi:hypothetical protein